MHLKAIKRLLDGHYLMQGWSVEFTPDPDLAARFYYFDEAISFAREFEAGSVHVVEIDDGGLPVWPEQPRRIAEYWMVITDPEVNLSAAQSCYARLVQTFGSETVDNALAPYIEAEHDEKTLRNVTRVRRSFYEQLNTERPIHHGRLRVQTGEENP